MPESVHSKTNGTAEFDVAIIGGGFFGCVLALLFRSITKRIVLIERGPALMERASAVNQARVHSGLHYPRSFATARRSQRDLPLFIGAFGDCIKTDFQMLYAIARRNSQVQANRFEAMFKDMGAPIQRAGATEQALFNPDMIEEVFKCDEFAFDWKKLRAYLTTRMQASDVPVRLTTEALNVGKRDDGVLEVTLSGGEVITTKAVFNVTYSQLNNVLSKSGMAQYPLKHELAEIALVDPPSDLEGLAVTVMDGPFFSIMPFPAEDQYSLTHVRYTPHRAWVDRPGKASAYEIVKTIPQHSRWRHMVQDAARYLPCMTGTKYRGSLFDVKTVLIRNEMDDGRPILFHEQPNMLGFYSVLGGKMDNIFDLSEYLPKARAEWSDLSTRFLIDPL